MIIYCTVCGKEFKAKNEWDGGECLHCGAYYTVDYSLDENGYEHPVYVFEETKK